MKQSGLYMDMTESRFDFESGAASRTVSMSTNLSFWNVLEKPSWVSVSPESGEAGEHTLTINVEDNPNTTKREGRVVVGNQGLSLADTLWVTQEGKSFGPLETVLQFENVASSNTLDISTDGDWTVTTSDGWITVAPSSGHGNGQVTVTVEANETDNERTGLLSVAVGGTVQYVNVVQKGRYFTIDRGPSASLPSKGGTIELGIATNQASREEPVLMVGTLRHARARRCQTGDFRPRQLQSGKPDRYHRIHACQQTRSEVGRQAGRALPEDRCTGRVVLL